MGIGDRVRSIHGPATGTVIDTQHGGATLLVEFDHDGEQRWVSWAHVYTVYREPQKNKRA
jgi:hypothetical protein